MIRTSFILGAKLTQMLSFMLLLITILQKRSNLNRKNRFKMCYGVARCKPEWHLQNHFFSVTWQHWTANFMGKKDNRVWGILSITVSRSPVPKRRVYRVAQKKRFQL